MKSPVKHNGFPIRHIYWLITQSYKHLTSYWLWFWKNYLISMCLIFLICKMSYPTSKVKGGGGEDYPTSKVRGGSREELPHIQSEEQRLCCSSHEEIPHVQGKRVGVERGHQRADRLKPQSQTTSQSDHTDHSLSNSMKLSHSIWGYPRWSGHGAEVWQNVVHQRREWPTASVFLPWEPHEQYEKAIFLTWSKNHRIQRLKTQV